jgi:hypothetical protein
MRESRRTLLLALALVALVLALPALSGCGDTAAAGAGDGVADTTTPAGGPATTATAGDLSGLIQAMSMPYPEGDGRYASSNPYDYTRNNPAFDRVVAMGYEALPGLEEYLPNHGGLDGYLVCIAIEKITRCDLKQFDEFMWASAGGFPWNKYLEQMPSMVEETLARNLDSDAQAAEIAKLGAPAVPYVVEHAALIDGQDGSRMTATLGALLPNAEPADTVEEFANLNAETIARLRAYVEDR